MFIVLLIFTLAMKCGQAVCQLVDEGRKYGRYANEVVFSH